MAFTFEKLIVYQKAAALFSGNLASRRGISGRSTLMVVSRFHFPACRKSLPADALPFFPDNASFSAASNLIFAILGERKRSNPPEIAISVPVVAHSVFSTGVQKRHAILRSP
jgi:hypothetical protein